jgi:hypothetical protein
LVGKKGTNLRTNPPNSIKNTSDAAEAALTLKKESKRRPRTEKVQTKEVETTEVPKAETIEVPEVEAAKLGELKTQEIAEIQTKEVQELQGSTLQKGASEQIEGEETLELSEKIIQDLDIPPEDAAFLEADPLYREYKEAQLPKYQRLDVKLYVLLRDDHLEFLARLTREIMKNRTSAYKKERITKNTIIRALIDNLKELELDVRNIPDEIELAKRIADSIRSVRSTTSIDSEKAT